MEPIWEGLQEQISAVRRSRKQWAQAKKTWHAYLSISASGGGAAVNARDRIGKGPWYNSIRYTATNTAHRVLLSENSQMAKRRIPPRVGPAPKLDRGIQLDRVRLVCGSIPGTIEKISHGEPTFFTPKRVFAMFANNHHGDGHVAVWIPAAPGVQAALIEEAPDTYFRPPYVGVGGWVGVELSRVDDDQLGALIREAFRLMTPNLN